jgi:hypothetical protein
MNALKVLDAIRCLPPERRAELYEERYGRRPPATASSTAVAEAILARLGDEWPPELESCRPRAKNKEARRRPSEVIGALLAERGTSGATGEEIDAALAEQCPWAKISVSRRRQHLLVLRKAGWDISVARDGRVRCFAVGALKVEEEGGGGDGDQ